MHYSQNTRLYRSRALLAVGACLAFVTLAVAVGELPSGDATSNSEREPSGSAVDVKDVIAEDEVASLLREGTKIQDQIGHFILTVDTAVFVNRHGRRFGMLKNLNLQRVMQMRRSTQALKEIEWSVSGTVTEFGGENFLLMSRAIRKSKKSKPRRSPVGSTKRPKSGR